ncbi:hypothetical protein BDP27DRAFT_1426960 [Rhodocollybia butyracea]|uniref:Uncharacterized protein n=1 Tax=Rhodocollybia butyracea TaxID=206335 RepID=A0A9P5PHM2_9AGAR|nr:hypothetical protein BDP27DRAFT_1426960 [Rhodocollybia butyracea]
MESSAYTGSLVPFLTLSLLSRTCRLRERIPLTRIQNQNRTPPKMSSAQEKAEAAARRAKAHEAALVARVKTTYEYLSAVSWDTSIPERQISSPQFGKPTSRKVKLVVSLNKLVQLPSRRIQDEDCGYEQAWQTRIQDPGLLVIDTTGHESLTNLRSRVVRSVISLFWWLISWLHDLKAQTKESLQLRDRKTPFIVALNKKKIDRLYGWQATPDGFPGVIHFPIHLKLEFEDRTSKIAVEFAE